MTQIDKTEHAAFKEMYDRLGEEGAVDGEIMGIKIHDENGVIKPWVNTLFDALRIAMHVTNPDLPEKPFDYHGPYIGNDIKLARLCAMSALPKYGQDDPITLERINTHGIWNDHIAVQSAFVAIQYLRRKLPA